MYDKYPYTDFHEMNLDWIIKEMKDLVDAWDSFGGSVSAEAHTASDPEVTVTGDLKNGLNFDFGLVQGPRGTTGAQGPQGEQGPPGEGLEILDVYPTLAALQAAHPTGSPGDAYLVGSGGNYTLYIWSSSSNAWSDGGSLTSPSPSSTAPAMDGVAAAGSSLLYSRGDHVHPSDTSKLDKSSSDGVYAVESGSQVMLDVSDYSQADAIVKYDSVGDLNAANINASGDVNAVDGNFSGDVAVTGDISCDEINVTTNAILNSAMLAAEVSSNAYRPMATVNPIDPITLVYDIADNIPSIKFTGVAYDSSGNRSNLNPEVKFTGAFKVNTADYAETRIDMAPASASALGGVKIGSGITVAADGTISAQAGSMTSELLWTNASPTSTFARQTITLDTSDYSEFIVDYKSYAGSDAEASIRRSITILEKDVDYAVSMSPSSTTRIYRRLASVGTSGVTFSDVTSNNSTDNNYLIPYSIYGIR